MKRPFASGLIVLNFQSGSNLMPRLRTLLAEPLQANVELTRAPSRSRADVAARSYSARSAASGSTREARYAGSAHAATAMSARTTGTVPNVTRSWLVVSYSSEATARATP